MWDVCNQIFVLITSNVGGTNLYIFSYKFIQIIFYFYKKKIADLYPEKWLQYLWYKAINLIIFRNEFGRFSSKVLNWLYSQSRIFMEWSNLGLLLLISRMENNTKINCIHSWKRGNILQNTLNFLKKNKKNRIPYTYNYFHILASSAYEPWTKSWNKLDDCRSDYSSDKESFLYFRMTWWKEPKSCLLRSRVLLAK